VNVALVVAGGLGVRFGRAEGKQLAPLAGRPMLYWTLAAMSDADSIDSIVVTFDPDGLSAAAALLEEWQLPKFAGIVSGGETRQDSVALGLAALPPAATVVAVHDGARPLVLPQDVDRCVAALPGWDGAVLGRPASDTLKRVDTEGRVAQTLDRSEIWQAETPQVFGVETLRAAHDVPRGATAATDDASLVESAGKRIRMVAATGVNLKVTRPEDIVLAEAVLGKRRTA
jgi:2-C-methyl-D-erythritol 4-phosphate cytidylyltransferase